MIPKLHIQPHLPHLFSNAFQWLCRSRKKHPPSSDIWDFRPSWIDRADAVMDEFRLGDYQLDVQKKMTLSDGETVAVWSSRDALVLKVLTCIIQQRLKPILPKTCYHLKGRRYYCVPWKFVKGATFSRILGAPSLYDPKTHDRIKPIEANILFQGAVSMTGRCRHFQLQALLSPLACGISGISGLRNMPHRINELNPLVILGRCQ